MWRRFLRNATLALAGLVVAVAVGLAANTISQDSIGLSAQPLRASDSLAPAEARRAEPSRERRARRRSARKRPAERPRARDTAGSGRHAATGSARDRTCCRALGRGRFQGARPQPRRWVGRVRQRRLGLGRLRQRRVRRFGVGRVGRLRRRRGRRLEAHRRKQPGPLDERARLRLLLDRGRRSALALLRDRHGLRLAGREVERPGALPGTGALPRGDDQVVLCACPS